MRITPKIAAIGGAVYIGVAAAAYAYTKRDEEPSTSFEKCCSADLFDRNAGSYDSQIDLDETLMGVKLLRRWLIRQATGDVLEVAAGTGRNLPYYDASAAKSLTLVDTSR